MAFFFKKKKNFFKRFSKGFKIKKRNFFLKILNENKNKIFFFNFFRKFWNNFKNSFIYLNFLYDWILKIFSPSKLEITWKSLVFFLKKKKISEFYSKKNEIKIGIKTLNKYQLKGKNYLKKKERRESIRLTFFDLKIRFQKKKINENIGKENLNILTFFHLESFFRNFRISVKKKKFLFQIFHSRIRPFFNFFNFFRKIEKKILEKIKNKKIYFKKNSELDVSSFYFFTNLEFLFNRSGHLFSFNNFYEIFSKKFFFSSNSKNETFSDLYQTKNFYNKRTNLKFSPWIINLERNNKKIKKSKNYFYDYFNQRKNFFFLLFSVKEFGNPSTIFMISPKNKPQNQNAIPNFFLRGENIQNK